MLANFNYLSQSTGGSAQQIDMCIYGNGSPCFINRTQSLLQMGAIWEFHFKCSWKQISRPAATYALY